LNNDSIRNRKTLAIIVICLGFATSPGNEYSKRRY
jgi:hypothetical protein